MGVKVKALEWRYIEGKGLSRAETVFGPYDEWGTHWRGLDGRAHASSDPRGGAQEDFNRRILASIEQE